MIRPVSSISLNNTQSQTEFRRLPNLAQYKGSDYTNVVHVERGISLDKAFEIARNNPDIDYFVYVKGYSMVLEFPPDVSFDPDKDPFHLVTRGRYIFDNGRPGRGYMRVFHQGDVVFFKNEGRWLGTAPGLADVYEKI